MKRTAMKRPRERRPARHGQHPVEFTTSIRRKALIRSGGCCEANLPGCGRSVDEFHHRRMKSQNGRGQLFNCLPCCSHCHRTIHAEVGWAHRHGLLVKSYADPEHTQVYPGCSTECRENHAEQ